MYLQATSHQYIAKKRMRWGKGWYEKNNADVQNDK
jgi:hypothetical protein